MGSAKYTLQPDRIFYRIFLFRQKFAERFNASQFAKREREREGGEGERELHGLIFSKSEIHQLQSRIVDTHIGISFGDTSYISTTYWICEQI